MAYVSLMRIRPNNKKQLLARPGKNCYNVANIGKQKNILHNFPSTSPIRTYICMYVYRSLISSLFSFRSLIHTYRITSQINPTAFQGLVALKELQLGHNRLRNLTPGLFSMSASLERLVLYANGIENLLRGTFQGLSNLTSLFLHSNHLRIMHPDLFQDTPNLRKL